MTGLAKRTSHVREASVQLIGLGPSLSAQFVREQLTLRPQFVLSNLRVFHRFERTWNEQSASGEASHAIECCGEVAEQDFVVA